MQIGDLNRRIQIQNQSTSQDEFGQPLTTWATVYSCWAHIGMQNSQLIYSTAEFVSKATHRIEMRWTSSVVISPNQRVVYIDPASNVTHTYNIEAVLNTDQKNRELILMCYELEAVE